MFRRRTTAMTGTKGVAVKEAVVKEAVVKGAVVKEAVVTEAAAKGAAKGKAATRETSTDPETRALPVAPDRVSSICSGTTDPASLAAPRGRGGNIHAWAGVLT